MPWIKGIPVTLYEKTQTGEDRFHDPIYAETPVTVENVLVTPADASAVTTELQLNGHHLAYDCASRRATPMSGVMLPLNFLARNGVPTAAYSSTLRNSCRWTGTRK